MVAKQTHLKGYCWPSNTEGYTPTQNSNTDMGAGVLSHTYPFTIFDIDISSFINKNSECVNIA